MVGRCTYDIEDVLHDLIFGNTGVLNEELFDFGREFGRWVVDEELVDIDPVIWCFELCRHAEPAWFEESR